MSFNPDIAVLLFYLAAIIGCGAWFTRKSPSADEYMSAQRTLPGWAVGLSMFGSYISSISFLANPGAAYSSNWNAFAFSLATPLGALIAVRWFVPFYRNSGEISAYEHLEHRFGRWARTYATVCFLLLQAARMGSVIYLMSIAVAPLISWEGDAIAGAAVVAGKNSGVPTIIAIAAGVMTFYTLAGGIKAVVWTGVLQSGVLIAGVVVCIATLLWNTQGGLGEILRSGTEENKFSLGSYGPSTVHATFWVTFLFGLVTHVANFGIDQSYIQRYLSARSTEQARLSVWITTLMYVPVAGVFFLIGTGLFVFYAQRPELLQGATGDKVFPHFIATQLPAGVSGLVVAAIVAASMDSNLNSMATLTLCDIYKPYLRPTAGERESLLVLKLSTIAWGVVSACVALAMIRARSALDAWWALSGAFSGGMLGLFLLGLFSRKATNFAAAIGVAVGVLVILWMTLPRVTSMPEHLRAPFHANLTMVLGTLTIFLVGLVVTRLAPARLPAETAAD